MPNPNSKRTSRSRNPTPTIDDTPKRRVGRPSKPIGISHRAFAWEKEKTPSKHTILVLGLGSGTAVMDQEELRRMWKKHGRAVTRYWRKKFDQDPWVLHIAVGNRW